MKWYYKNYGIQYNWIIAATAEQAREMISKKYGIKNPRLLSLDLVIAEMASDGWAVNYRDEAIITFTKKVKKSWSGAIAFWFFAPVLVALGWYMLLESSGGETGFAFIFGCASIGFCWSIAGICFLISIFQPPKDKVATVLLGPKDDSVVEISTINEPASSQCQPVLSNQITPGSMSVPTKQKTNWFLWLVIIAAIALVQWAAFSFLTGPKPIRQNDEPNFISVNGQVAPNPNKK